MHAVAQAQRVGHGRAMNTPALHFVPLGGSGEIGMNMNLYGHDDAWIMVDCGMGFERVGAQMRITVPDPRWAASLGGKLLGLVVTHVHLDHLGAIDVLWPRLRCPVHLTPFAAAVLRPRLREARLEGHVPLVVHEVGDRFDLGPFDIEYVGLTHSTHESTGLAIRTPAGTVFHTGDYKLDPEPTLGPRSDLSRIAELGQAGVDAVIGDSTNATKEGRSTSEATVAAHLDTLVGEATGRVVVATFSSHIARLRTLAALAAKHDRHPVLVGRSMHRMVAAAREVGLLTDVGPFLAARDAAYLPRDKVLCIATGTQAEPRSALVRIAQDNHPTIQLDAGDTVILSSKVIPGNEADIARMHGLLKARGLTVIHELDDPSVHASGHPCRDELRELYGLLQPGVVVPVHGEGRHMAAHAALAGQLDLPAIEVRNGDVVHLGPGTPRKLDEGVPHGRIMRRR